MLNFNGFFFSIFDIVFVAILIYFMNYFRGNGQNDRSVDSDGLPTPPVFYWQQTVSKHEEGGYGVIVIF
jgi:hypothetical protein